MKKILAMLLAIAMLACLFAGCGNSDKSNDGSTPGSDAAPGTDVTAASDYEELQDKGTMVVAAALSAWPVEGSRRAGFTMLAWAVPLAGLFFAGM